MSAKIEKLLKPYLKLNLECDGFSKVVSYILDQNGIRHYRVVGDIIAPDGSTMYHEWVELPGNKIIDYRARMWFGNSAPHGIFKKNNTRDYTYNPKGEYTNKVSEFIFKLLCSAF